MANVNVTVTINAAGAQAGSQTFTNSVNQMAGAVSAFSPQLALINNNLNTLVGLVNNLTSANKNAAGSFSAFTAASLAADAIRDLASEIKDLIVESTLYAARTQELGVALNAVAKASGTSIETIKQQEFAMKQLNITTQDARQSITRFIQADLDINKAGALARTAQDLAVIAGLSTSDEINKLVIAIQTLQSRNLRTAGVFFTVDEVLDRLAKTSHRARDSFSTLEKQQAVLNEVLLFGTRVAGTYEAAMGTASKQIRSMERLIFEAQNSFGSLFIPALEQTVKVLSEMFVAIEKHPKIFATLLASVAALSAAFVLVNTSLVKTLGNFTAFIIQGIIRMYSTLPGLSISLVKTAASIKFIGTVAEETTVEVTGLQLALGSLAGIAGIALLVVGLAGSLLTLTGSSEEYIKIVDSQIKQSTSEIASYKARIKTIEEYNNSLKDLENRNVTAAIPEFQNYQGVSQNLEKVNKEFSTTQGYLEDLGKQSAQLQKNLSKIPESISNVNQRADLSLRIEDTNKAYEVQSKRLAELSQQRDNLTQKEKVAEKALLDAVGGRQDNLEAIAKNLELSSQVAKANDKATAQEKSLTEVLKDRQKALQTLQDRELQRLSAIGIALEHNLTLAAKETEQVKKSADFYQSELTRLEKSGQTFNDQYSAAIEGSFNKLFPVLTYLLKTFFDRDAVQLVKDGFTFIGANAGKAFSAGLRAAAGDTSGIVEIFKSVFATSSEEQVQGLLKNLTEADAKLADLRGRELEYSRQVSDLADALGYTSEEYVKFILKIDESNPRFADNVKNIETLRQAHKDLQDQLDAGRYSQEAFNQALDKFSFAPLEPTGQEKLTRYLSTFDKTLKQFGEIHPELGTKGQGTSTIIDTILGDPKVLDTFNQQAEKGAKDIEKMVDLFGGDRQKALDSYFANAGFASKELEEKVRTLLNVWLDYYDQTTKAAQKARRNQDSEFDKMQKTLERTQEQIQSFLNVGSPEAKLRVKLENAERVKKDLEAITTLRYKMGIPLDVPIKLENVQQTRKDLEILAKVFDEISAAQNAYEEARLKVGAPVISAEVRAATTLLKLTRDRREEEQQLAADIAVAISKRIKLENDAAEIRRIESNAFLAALNEEQSKREELLSTLTKVQIHQGDFSFAAGSSSSEIQNGIKVANSAVVTAINDTQATIARSIEEINRTQVDFSLAFGHSISDSAKDLNQSIHTHSSAVQGVMNKQLDVLNKIESNTKKETTPNQASSTGLNPSQVPSIVNHIIPPVDFNIPKVQDYINATVASSVPLPATVERVWAAINQNVESASNSILDFSRAIPSLNTPFQNLGNEAQTASANVSSFSNTAASAEVNVNAASSSIVQLGSIFPVFGNQVDSSTKNLGNFQGLLSQVNDNLSGLSGTIVDFGNSVPLIRMGPTIEAGFSSPAFGPAPKTTGSRGGTGHTLTTQQMKFLLLQQGATEQQANILAAIGQAESSGRTGIINYGNPNAATENARNEHSVGLFQINRTAHPQYTDAQLQDPKVNARVALEVLAKEGYDAWTTFTKGTYLKYLDAASRASAKSAFEFTQKSLPSSPVIPFLGDLSKPRPSGELYLTKVQEKLYKNFGVTPTETNRQALKTEEGIQAALNVTKQNDDLAESNKLRAAELALRKQMIPYLDKQHAIDLKLTQDEEDFARAQRVRVDNVFEISKRERELLLLRTNSIAVTEELQKVETDRLDAEIEAQKELIRVQAESDRRANPVQRAHDVNLLLQKEYVQRIKQEQELDNNIVVLQKQIDDQYFISIDNRRRIEKQAYYDRQVQYRDLVNHLIELDEELAHHNENSALRYKVVWKEALLEVQNRHEDAVNRILKAQASITDQNTYDVARIRAKVLEGINQIENVSDSVGGLFTDAFKVYTDDIDKWIDKTTDKLGNLGKIFNGFFKSIAHRFVGGIQNTLLDAIFPPTPEEKAAKGALQIGGADKAEAALNSLAEATNNLGAVNGETTNITIQTASALNGLTNSAGVASQALAQIAAVVASIGGQSGTAGPALGLGGGSVLNFGGLSGGGGSGVSSLTSAISSIGLGGLGASRSAATGSSIANIFQGALSNPYTNSGSSSASTINALISHLNDVRTGGGLLSTTLGPLATLSGSTGGGLKGLVSSTFGGFKNILGAQGSPLKGLTSLFSKAGLKGFLGGIGPQLPLLGLGLGASLGGSSKLGAILGGAGGLLLGGAGLFGIGGLLAGGAAGAGAAGLGAAGVAGVGAGVSGGLLGSLSALLTNPFTIAAGAALLVGAYFLGKKKQRQRDEKTRDELKGDAFAQIDQILKNVKTDRMDGVDAITQAESIRDSYYTQISQLKTGSVKKSAENYRAYFDAKIEAIRREADLQLRRKEISDKLVPEFATGGVASAGIIKVQPGELVIPLKTNERVMAAHEQQKLFTRGGVVSGLNKGVDDTYVAAQSNALILSKKQTDEITRKSSFAYGGFVKKDLGLYPQTLVNSVASYNTYAGVFANAASAFNPHGSGLVSSPVIDSAKPITIARPTAPVAKESTVGDIVINMSASLDAEGMVLKVLGSNTGQKVITNVANQAISSKRVNRRI